MTTNHPMLNRVYNIGSTAECENVYDDWAGTYDDDTTQGMGYVAPAVAADRVAAFVTPDRAVLDAGCGTGLVGAELRDRGFATIDGIDLSAGMLDTARAKGCYRNLDKADLTARLPLDDATYDAVVCVGTLTEGHVGPAALDELTRVVRPGGYLVATVLERIWESLGYHRHIADLQAHGRAQLIEAEKRPYHVAEDIDCRLCVLQIA